MKNAPKPLSVQALSVLGTTAITVICLFVAFLFLRQNQLLQHFRDEITHTHEVTESLQSLSNKVKDAVLYHRNFLLSNDEAMLAPYYALAHPDQALSEQDPPLSISINRHLEDLARLIADNSRQGANLEQLTTAMTQLFSFLNNITALHQMEEVEAHSAVVSKHSEDLLSAVLSKIVEMREHENILLEMRTHKDEAASVENVYLILAAISFFYVCMLCLYWMVLRQWQQTKAMEVLQMQRAEEANAANDHLKIANKTLAQLNEQIKASSQVRLHAVVDHSLDGIITMRDDGKIESFNPACEKMFGYSHDEIIGKPLTLLMPEPYASLHDGYLLRYNQTGMGTILGTSGREVPALRKDGTLFQIELAVISFTLGDEVHFSGTIRDITARKRAEAELNRYMKELERSNQELDDFAYIVSHDLKEPLRGLFNHAMFLLEDYRDKLDDDGARRLSRLSQLAQRMEKLVNDLLYFSRLGRSELAIQATDLNQVVVDITQMMEGYLKDRHAQINVPQILPPIVCDKTRITEALRNLITNAVKYNDKPEPIVEIGFIEHVNAPHGIEKDVFYVKDNGIGIAQEFHQDIFRIFKRLNIDDGVDAGTGVGLTFVKKIVERHRGHIWLESAHDKGTTFFFNINQPEAIHAESEKPSHAKYSSG